MDSLLRYILFSISKKILIYELIFMGLCCIAIITIKIISRMRERKTEKTKNEISQKIENALLSQESLDQFTLPSSLRDFRKLIEEMECFDQKFDDPRWKEIKKKIISTYLLNEADAKVQSRNWFKRQLAGRCYLLCPELAKEENLKKLLNDPKYLVRVTAAVCITKTPFKSLFNEVIKKMSEETPLSQFPYRDALVQMDQEKFQWLESILESKPDSKIAAICLDVLSTRYTNNFFPLIKPYVTVEDRPCRLLAFKALSNIPSNESIELLSRHLNDSDWEVRAEVIKSLHQLHATALIPQIQELLNDPVWWVRLQAAIFLKDLGKEGSEILEKQDKENAPKAYEIARYVLALP